MTLSILWFLIIGLLFAIFVFMEGFDFGVGMSTQLIAHDQMEREAIMSSIGPHWDGNETWLVTAGGAMFAALPIWYASLFSTYYYLLMLVLVSLIIRGVSFEFTKHAETKFGKNLWMWTFFCGSFFAPFLLVMMLTSMIQGVPLNANGDAIGLGFFDVVNWLSLVGGVAGVLLSLVHGLNFLRLRMEGPIRDRARQLNKVLYPILFAGEVVFALLVIFQTDFFTKKPVSTTIIILFIVLFSLLGYYGVLKDREGWSFVGSGLSLSTVIVLIFNGMFPRVMIGTHGNSISIANAANSHYTLTVMTIVACILVPIILIYFIWSYTLFTKRINPKDNTVKY
ncbi:cytochrome C oxidase assembly protein [Companilactobacillus ginsenosidimutans]|uniref:Cytochrome C oxidase assembly protein n=2 Tax=Companilactobacillus ginsenosidimutans TaxID=1007676 RepID=A0A0H4QLZ0_9LACO|nr:cytochrome d ubiquinol oxidase subunit II [Companilactobacillus ginsenosidimutans]AKP67723.1 cytochrome C oxidase assembly protein [Companilactobacillus ginsenosidimutans]